MNPAVPATSRSNSMTNLAGSLRLTIAIAALTLSAVLACVWVWIHDAAQHNDAFLASQITGIAHGETRELLARLQAAEAMVQEFAAVDAGDDGQSLRNRVRASEVFTGVVLVPWPRTPTDPLAPEIQSELLTPLKPEDLLALRSGQSTSKLLNSGQVGVYLVHAVPVGREIQLGFFKVAPAWLWQGVDLNPTQSVRELNIAVIDVGSHVLRAPTDIPSEFVKVFVQGKPDTGDPLHPVVLNWHFGGHEWQASMVSLEDNNSTHLRRLPWTLVVYGVYEPGVSPAHPFRSATLNLLLLTCLLASVAVAWLLRRGWSPVLCRLQAGLAALRDGELRAIEIGNSRDLPRALASTYNQALDALSRRMQAQGCLAHIDRLLLEAPEVEQSIEAILKQVGVLLPAQVVAAALLDGDAPGHARVFVDGGDAASAVWRINLDPEVAAALQAAPRGLALSPDVTEHAALLEPLHKRGGRYFHIWPVLVGDVLTAVLATGFVTEPTAEALSYGAQCAERLHIALSKELRGERLYRQAHFDSLTGLPNRVLFRDRLSQELATTGDSAQRGALLYVDLDHFKKVNDTVGHIAGDQLLVTVAQRLRACVKEGDTVARLGGDEFTVILRNLPSADAAREVAERIIESLQRPVNVGGRDHHVRASIGITLFPDDSAGIEELMRNADLAMYQAKDGGRSRAVFFDTKMARVQSPAAQSGLFRALRRREFALHYQPQYMLHTGELIGLEALIRWQNPREGLRMPGEFVPAAEQSGLIVEIGAWVLDSACKQFAQWRDAGIAPSRLALNLSVQQLRMSDFAALVREALERFDLPPQSLELEVTESVFAEEDARAGMRALAALGVRLALDDFGTGYSSLNYLRAHPVDVIKIDRSFMHEVPDNQQAVTLASTIIDMAHALGKQVVAEGVETLRQLEFLRTRGCDIAQGYALGRPVSVAEIGEVLAARRGTPVLEKVG